MRDILKNPDYFTNFITREVSRMEKYVDVRRTIIEERGENDAAVSEINYNLFKFSQHILIASYSMGKSIDETRLLFHSVCDWFLQVKDVSYADAVQVVSLCVLFNYEGYLQKIVKKVIELNLIDKFMKFLIQDSSLFVNCKGFSEYDKISNIEKATDKSAVIRTYLSSWYSVNEGSYWYDSHNSKNNVYFGYWCFESAAAVKILRLSSCDFQDNKYFPQDFL